MRFLNRSIENEEAWKHVKKVVPQSRPLEEFRCSFFSALFRLFRHNTSDARLTAMILFYEKKKKTMDVRKLLFFSLLFQQIFFFDFVFGRLRRDEYFVLPFFLFLNLVSRGRLRVNECVCPVKQLILKGGQRDEAVLPRGSGSRAQGSLGPNRRFKCCVDYGDRLKYKITNNKRSAATVVSSLFCAKTKPAGRTKVYRSSKS